MFWSAWTVYLLLAQWPPAAVIVSDHATCHNERTDLQNTLGAVLGNYERVALQPMADLVTAFSFDLVDQIVHPF